MPSGKVASLSFQNFRVFAMVICSVIYTVSCMPVAKVYHVQRSSMLGSPVKGVVA